MKCRFCGTEVADKALICYRCGRATTDPKVAPPTGGSIFEARRRSKRPFVIVAIVLLILALIAWVVFRGIPGINGQVLPPAYGRLAATPVAPKQCEGGTISQSTGPIIDWWLSASFWQPSSPPPPRSSSCRTARWEKASADMSTPSAPRSRDAAPRSA